MGKLLGKEEVLGVLVKQIDRKGYPVLEESEVESESNYRSISSLKGSNEVTSPLEDKLIKC